MGERRSRSSTDTWILVGLVGVVLVLAVPYGLRGPGYLREDWEPLRNAAFDGWWAAAGGRVALSRPVSGVVFAVLFGLVGAHPLVVFAVLTAANAVVAVLIFLVAREVLPRRPALVTALVWTLLPTHTALSNWPSAAPALFALALVLVGTLLLMRAVRDGRSVWPAIGIMAASALCYEATLPVAAAAVVAVPPLVVGRMRPDVVRRGLVLVPVGLWAALASPKPEPEMIRLADIVGSNFGWGINPNPVVKLVIGLPILVGVTVAFARLIPSDLRPRTAVGERLVAAGVAVVVLGVMPFVGFGQDIDFVAQGDRANMVCAIGAAMVLAGLVEMIRSSPAAAVTLVVVLALVALPTRWDRDRDYAETAHDVKRVLAHVERTLPSGVRAAVIGTRPISHDGVEGLENDWDAGLAFQHRFHDPDFRVRYVYSERELVGEPNAFDVDTILRRSE
ncbi:MAG: hypothetical protein QOG87_3337 [Actinomycetota bacterium]